MIDAYNISYMLMNYWRTYAMRASGTPGKLGDVPVYVEVNGELVKVVGVEDQDNKIVLIKETT
jgi:hypothetical protein